MKEVEKSSDLSLYHLLILGEQLSLGKLNFQGQQSQFLQCPLLSSGYFRKPTEMNLLLSEVETVTREMLRIFSAFCF